MSTLLMTEQKLSSGITDLIKFLNPNLGLVTIKLFLLHYYIEKLNMLKLSKTITSNEIHAEIAATEKEPKKESATMAPMTGNKLVQLLVMFEI
jgi:hypothetical protein